MKTQPQVAHGSFAKSVSINQNIDSILELYQCAPDPSCQIRAYGMYLSRVTV